MSTWLKVVLWVVGSIVATFIVIYFAVDYYTGQDSFVAVYQENCATCHGEQMEGNALGPPLVGAELKHGTSIDEISISIAEGFPTQGMPGWNATFDEAQIQSMAILIAEKRVNRNFTDFRMDAPFEIPVGPIESELVTFQLEIVAEDLHHLPFSIEPMPDGNILLTEKVRGMTIISPAGDQSDLITGTPETYDDGFNALGVEYGLGWMLDVALHPNYEDNGWIYLHFADRCRDCPAYEENFMPASMNKLIRGRIRDGEWVDEETIWEVPQEFYTVSPETGAGGRIAFDPEGFVFVSVGIKGLSNYDGPQELAKPYGKIHRLHENGDIPVDNPFVDTPGAMKSVWTYGHRSPQGLEFHAPTGQLWGTEMGPRGGDEVNWLRPGRNFGWPLYSKGVNYDGTKVDYGKILGIEFDLEDIEQPVVDLTPSPAVSSFVIYDGGQFPEWQDQFIVGSLKATELYRFVIRDGELQHEEILLSDFTRIRDVEVDYDGSILLLLEQREGGKIVRMSRSDGYKEIAAKGVTYTSRGSAAKRLPAIRGDADPVARTH